MHALHAIAEGKRGRGNKGGGLKEYAERLGKDAASITRYRQAAEVMSAVREKIDSSQSFLDKAQHLAAIHALPPNCWARAVGAIGTDSAARIKERVDKAREFYESHGQGTAEAKAGCQDTREGAFSLVCTGSRRAEIRVFIEKSGIC